MFKKITREELKAKRDRGETFHLVNVLSHEAFDRQHIPGSANVPLPDLEERAPTIFGKADEIIVYCSSFDCSASTTAAAILDRLGFTNVADFEGGMRDWAEAGYPVAFARKAA